MPEQVKTDLPPRPCQHDLLAAMGPSPALADTPGSSPDLPPAYNRTHTDQDFSDTDYTSPCPIDNASIKGHFGYLTFEDASIPYIIRGEKPYLPVRILDLKVLAHYPDEYPPELGEKNPLVSHYVTQAEAILLNEINVKHNGGAFGSELFTTNDVVVKAADFDKFLDAVKKYFAKKSLVGNNKKDSHVNIQTGNYIPEIWRKNLANSSNGQYDVNHSNCTGSDPVSSHSSQAQVTPSVYPAVTSACSLGISGSFPDIGRFQPSCRTAPSTYGSAKVSASQHCNKTLAQDAFYLSGNDQCSKSSSFCPSSSQLAGQYSGVTSHNQYPYLTGQFPHVKSNSHLPERATFSSSGNYGTHWQGQYAGHQRYPSASTVVQSSAGTGYNVGPRGLPRLTPRPSPNVGLSQTNPSVPSSATVVNQGHRMRQNSHYSDVQANPMSAAFSAHYAHLGHHANFVPPDLTSLGNTTNSVFSSSGLHPTSGMSHLLANNPARAPLTSDTFYNGRSASYPIDSNQCSRGQSQSTQVMPFHSAAGGVVSQQQCPTYRTGLKPPQQHNYSNVGQQTLSPGSCVSAASHATVPGTALHVENPHHATAPHHVTNLHHMTTPNHVGNPHHVTATNQMTGTSENPTNQVSPNNQTRQCSRPDPKQCVSPTNKIVSKTAWEEYITIDGVKCGWFLVNTTLVPFVQRRYTFMPLPVLQHAAELLPVRGVQGYPGYAIRINECSVLNMLVRKAGLSFSFTMEDTKMISLNRLLKEVPQVKLRYVTPTEATDILNPKPVSVPSQTDPAQTTPIPVLGISNLAPSAVNPVLGVENPAPVNPHPTFRTAVPADPSVLMAAVNEAPAAVPTVQGEVAATWQTSASPKHCSSAAEPIPSPANLPPAGATNSLADGGNGMAELAHVDEQPQEKPAESPATLDLEDEGFAPLQIDLSFDSEDTFPRDEDRGQPGLLTSQLTKRENASGPALDERVGSASVTEEKESCYLPMASTPLPSPDTHCASPACSPLLSATPLQHTEEKGESSDLSPPIDALPEQSLTLPELTFGAELSLPKEPSPIESSSSDSVPPAEPPCLSQGNVVGEVKVMFNSSTTSEGTDLHDDISKSSIVNSQSQEKVAITRVKFEGNTISCVHTGATGEPHALLEAFSRVYFPFISNEELLYAITVNLNLPVVTLNDKEEAAFIDYYSLPVTKLRCNKLLNLTAIDFKKLWSLFKSQALAYDRKQTKTTLEERKRKNSTDSLEASSKRRSVDTSMEKAEDAPVQVVQQGDKIVICID